MSDADLRFVIARSESDEAIHGTASGEVDCFASLAMTTEDLEMSL
jgi:hypothetical protein